MAQAYSNNTAGIQQAYAVDCFTHEWPPHSLDFNPTETLWGRSLSCRQFRVLARMQWNSRQKYMFWHCISVFKCCHFSQQKGIWGKINDKRLLEKEHAAASLLIRGRDAGCNVCMFECSAVCWLTVQIRPPYQGSGYLSHSLFMASSCNMSKS